MTAFSRRVFLRASAVATTAFALPHARAQAPVTLKWANVLPASHPSSVRSAEVAEQIRAETRGRIEMQVFPGGQLGGDNELLSQLRAGAIDSMLLSPVILATLIPVASISGLGFAFKSYDEVWAAMDGDLGAHVRGAIQKAGIVAMARMWDSGYRHVTSAARSIGGPEDLKGFKIRVPIAPMWTSMFKALGASPVGLNFTEVYSALQTRIMDGQENPLPIVQSSRLYEVQKHCTLTGHMWDGHWFLFNARSWARIPAELQPVVARVIDTIGVAQRADIAALTDKLKAQLTTAGMNVRTVDKAPFQQALRGAGFYAEWKGRFGEEAWATLERYAGRLA